MASQTPEDVTRALGNERHAPLYLLHGAETFLRDEVLGGLREYVFARSPKDFNYDQYDIREGQLEHALATARTLPMMGPMRLVVLRGVELVLSTTRTKSGDPAKKGRRKRKGIDPQTMLEDYVASPEPRTVFVMLADKVDARRKAVRQISKDGVVVDLKPLKPRAIPTWIERRARQMGLRLQGPTASLLADILGTDLGTIVRSLEKLQLYVGDRAEITPTDVEACVARTKVHAVFELMDAVGRRRPDKALALLHRMLEHREAPLMILAMLIRQIRRIWLVASLSAAGCPPNELADRAGVMSFLLEDIRRQARLFSRDDLLRALDLLFDTDRALKSSGGQPERLMELLVLGLCTHNGQQRRS